MSDGLPYEQMSDELPRAEDLQFHRAEPIPTGALEQQPILRCRACQQVIPDEYYRAQTAGGNVVVCGPCVQRIQSGQQSPPSSSLLHAVLYGGAAAIAGCALYAAVSIVTGLEVGIVAIVVGIMVGKAIRYASHGLGGRPQQILAVGLTYFAITTSYVSVFLFHALFQTTKSTPSVSAILYVLSLALIAPFMSLTSSPVSSLLSLFIIFIGLQRAWILTRRTGILVSGPYQLPKD